VAERYGTDHHEFLLTFDEIIAAVPQVLDHVAEPFGDSSLIPTWLVSQYTRRHVKVALSGDGGDELFGGYWRHRGLDYLSRYRRLPQPLRRWMVDPILRWLPAGKDSWLANRVRQGRKMLRATGGGSVLDDYLSFCAILDPTAEVILEAGARNEFSSAVVAQTYEACTGDDRQPDDSFGQILLRDLRYALPNDMLQKIDLASMRHGLEVRVPILDAPVVEYAIGLPKHYKLAGGQSKRVLIDGHRDLLPVQIQDRAKMGFEVPVGEYLRGPLREMFCEVVSADVVAGLGWLDHAGIMRVYEQHCRRRAEHGDLLYALLSLCWWWRRWAGCGIQRERLGR
jgi:asparagine synthase (glutamine-hydrolysing)